MVSVLDCEFFDSPTVFYDPIILDDQIIEQQYLMAQLQSNNKKIDHKKIEKCRAELKRLQMCRLKQSQNVPLIIKEIDTQTVYHFRKMFIHENTEVGVLFLGKYMPHPCPRYE